MTRDTAAGSPRLYHPTKRMARQSAKLSSSLARFASIFRRQEREPNWIARAQAVADAQKVPVKFFVSNEEYGTWVDVPGSAHIATRGHHRSAGSDFGGPLAKEGVVMADIPRAPARAARKSRRAAGLAFGENEELVRLYLDDSVDRGGYSAISTFHFGNPDFTNTEPFLHRWRGKIPMWRCRTRTGQNLGRFADMTTGFEPCSSRRSRHGTHGFTR